MKLFGLQCLVGAITLLTAAWLGHYLTLWSLRGMEVIPESHDEKQGRISKWIGVCERVVVALLTMCGSMALTVFVFATKAGLVSIRVGGEKEGSRRTTTEYILIGTLTSYFFGLLAGMAGWRGQTALQTYFDRKPRQFQVQAASLLSPVALPKADTKQAPTPAASPAKKAHEANGPR